MSGHSRKYKIMLTNEERNQLKEVLRSNKTCNTIKKRCQILLALDCNTNPDTTYRNCAYYLGVSLKMVCNIVKLYCESGLQRTLTLNRNVNSDNARVKLTVPWRPGSLPWPVAPRRKGMPDGPSSSSQTTQELSWGSLLVRKPFGGC